MSLITVRLVGGLGNMLFQISAAYAISLRDNKEFVLHKNEIHPNHANYTDYLTNFLRKFRIVSDGEFNNPYGENGFSFSEIPKFNDGVFIFGYFQSEKYFKKYRNEILEIFEIDDDTKIYLNDKYGDLLNLNTCSLHVRRGDYLGLDEYHPVLDIEYYKKSVSYFNDDIHFLIFSNDIDWCKKNFDFIKNKTFISNNHNYQDLYLMSMCDHNIIANSSFSWWGAWLNQNDNKKVISPQKWFGYKYSSYNTNDLYCEGWIKL